MDRRHRLTRAAAQEFMAVAFGYLLAAVALTWPMLLNPGSAPFADYGDARGLAWSLWARSHGHFDAAVNPLIAAPFGIASTQVVLQPISDGILVLLAGMWNEIAAMNLFAIAGMWTTALATYALLRSIELRPGPAFFGGLVFGFCPAAVLQIVGGHAAFAFNAFVPLFVLALIENRRRRRFSSALLVAASFAAICFVALYTGYFAMYVGLFFVALDALTCPPRDRPALVRNYAVCAFAAIVLLLPVEFLAIREQLTQPREAIARAGHVRTFHELFVYSSRPWDYLVPSLDHPVFGRYVEPFVRSRLHGSNAFEQTLYLGIVPLALLASGLVLVFRRRMEPVQLRLFVFFATAALWMYFVSLPPEVGSGIPTLSYFAYEVAPMFRVYARAGLMVCLFVGCAAAVVLAHWQRVLSPSAFRALLGAALAALALDYWSVPPGRAEPQSIPEVYRWLGSQGDDVVIAEYPMVTFEEAAFYSYPYWQRVHGKRILNGATPDNPRAWQLFESVKDLRDTRAPGLLKQAGVKFAIVHRDLYMHGPIPGPIKRYYPPELAAISYDPPTLDPIPPGFTLHRRFGEDYVLLVGEGDNVMPSERQ